MSQSKTKKEEEEELSLREFAHMKVASGLIDNYIIWNKIQSEKRRTHEPI
jgi:hypothetical protein